MYDNFEELNINEGEEEKSKKIGIDNGKRALKKQQKKHQRRQTIRAFWKSLPRKARLIIIGVSAGLISFILLCAVTLYIIEEEADRTSTDEEYDSIASVTDEIIDITIADMLVEEASLQNYINSYNSTNLDLKNTMLANTSEIIKWQQDNGYSAMFLITVAFEEDERVEEFNFDTLFNDIKDKSAAWKENGCKTVKEIAEVYVADDTAGEWANNIENSMQENSGSDTN